VAKVKINGKNYFSVWLEDDFVKMIDQRILPHSFEIASFNSAESVAEAIKSMVVRGAPAIGAAGIYGMALAKIQGSDLDRAYDILLSSRPTAYDLRHALDFFMSADGNPAEVAREYCRISCERCRMIGVHGAELFNDGMNVLTHCNAGALACVDWGTALSPIRIAHSGGKNPHVWVCETRPRLQGAKLTSWELMQEGIRHTLTADNAAGYLMREGFVDLVIVGADRIAANGDVANKIGTYERAVCARENNIPFYVAAPSSTFDRNSPTGDEIPIEERDNDELTHAYGLLDDGTQARILLTYNGCPVKNPAFDVTPAKYVTGYITEEGIIESGKFL
jgi:S-methyl-5-thioribose-1-phosphate isomerase